MPYLREYAAREPEAYRLTDPGVMTLAARLYRFRPPFRQQAAAILGEMAIGYHTGEWSRALDECGDDTADLIEAFERVSEREHIELADSLSDLGHLTSKTREVWLQRLQFVSEHPLGQRTEHAIGPRYDVPTAFLREQDPTVVLQYVEKLVAIGCDVGEFVLNRAAALTAVVNAIDTLSVGDKRRLFELVKPLVEQSTQISEADRFHVSTQHPLSRFRISLGSATNLRASAGRFLAGAATSPDEFSVVVELALDWVRSDEPILQGAGAAILTLSNLSSGTARNSELARHSNPSVRKAAVWMPSMHEYPDAVIIEQLAVDPDRGVRVAVAQALPHIASMGADSYERIRARLNSDESAIVRACASPV